MTNEWISVLALVVSTGVASLQVRSWLASGPRLRLHVMADALMFPHGDNNPKLALFVTNRGDTPTTITHMVIFIYPSRWAKFRRKSKMSAVVNSPNVPAEVGVNKQWNGMMLHEKKTTEARAKGHLYVGVRRGSLKRTFRKIQLPGARLTYRGAAASASGGPRNISQ